MLKPEMNFKKYFQSLSFEKQIFEINDMINVIHSFNQIHINTKRKYSTINHLKKLRRQTILDNKEIFMLLCNTIYFNEIFALYFMTII